MWLEPVTRLGMCVSNAAGAPFSLEAVRLNPASIDKVFFSADLVSRGSRLTYPGGCGVLTLEHFEKIKMAANIATQR